MFDISVFADPRRLRREFLASSDVATQSMGSELRSEFDKLREESPDLQFSGNLWLDFLRAYRRHLSLLVAGRAAGTLLVLGAVLVSEEILDATNSLGVALWFLFLFAVSQFGQRLLNAWTSLLQSQLLVCTRTFVTLRLNTKLLKMGNLTSDEFSTGNLKTLISSDIYRVFEFLHSVFRNGVPCVLGVIFLGPVIWLYMGTPGLIAMGVGFGALPLGYLFGKYVFRKEGLIKAEEDRLATIVGEWVTNVRVLRYLGWETLMRTRVATHVRRLVVESTKQHALNLVNFGVSVSWWLMPIIALIWANDLLGHTDDLVKLFASIWMLNHITLYIRFLPGIFISYSASAACVKRLNALFEHRDVTDDLREDSEVDVSSRPARMNFRNVSFSYGDEAPVIDGLNLSIDLNRTTALIGEVGSGKSTLLKLIVAELKPSGGTIEVVFDSGERADLWHENVYRRVRTHFGYMPQEAYLSNASLAVNVALHSGFGEQDVMDAIRFAELEADIDHWDGGIAEEVGETGVNLSGGQKQRVNLARALHSGRPYLVLDDPLSAVDTTTEAALMDTLLARTTGFFLSSHRLTELVWVDRLLVLDAGRIVEDCPPAALASDETSEFAKHLAAAEASHE